MLTVLVVDDEEPVRRYVARLMEDEGYRPITAGDGEEALALLERLGDLVHLVITDVSMPRLGGPELAARLALRPDPLPLLFMSGNSRKTPPGPLLIKPFLPEDLRRMVRHVLLQHLMPSI